MQRKTNAHTQIHASIIPQTTICYACMYIQLDTWLNLLLISIDILSKNTPDVKKGEAKSEAPKIILFMYSTKKIDIVQVEAKACN